MFQSRCRDLGVGELATGGGLVDRKLQFQSRCRDLGVGERLMKLPGIGVWEVSVSLPRFGGWRGWKALKGLHLIQVSVSLPRFGGWRACPLKLFPSTPKFQSRCRDLGVGE